MVYRSTNTGKWRNDGRNWEDPLAEVIRMDEARRQIGARRGFQSWTQRYGESFDESTCLPNLSDSTLGSLIEAGEQTSLAIHDLVMGVKNLGKGAHFHSLDTSQKMAIMDIAIFLLDQLRFECMRRLGWINGYATMAVPMVELISGFETGFAAVKNQTPELLPGHPRYQDYMNEFDMDRGAFLRRLIPEAIETFQQRLKSS
jgi:hypothetical protein